MPSRTDTAEHTKSFCALSHGPLGEIQGGQADSN